VEQAGEVRSARIESVRALAALAVLLTHVVGAVHQGAEPDDLGNRLLFSGVFAVYLFFALSGYLLYRPFAEAAFGPVVRRVDLRRYARNRAVRILPLYYVALVVYLLVREGGGSLGQWLVFAGFGENFSRSTILDVNPVLWSIVIELHFYVLLPLVAVVVARLSRGSIRTAAALLVALGVASLLLRWFTLYGVEGEPNPYLRYSLPSCFMFFVPGMALALLGVTWERRRPAALDRWAGTSTAWVAAGAAVWLLMAVGTGRGHLAAPASFLLVGACVLPLRDGAAVRALDWRPLAVVGVASYSLYVWHVLVVDELYQRGLRSILPLLAVSLPLCVAVALVSYAGIERPFLRLRRRWASTPDRPARTSRAHAT
jgi:peptidoglycan/LPS O-acetylase OafA/YrhL